MKHNQHNSKCYHKYDCRVINILEITSAINKYFCEVGKKLSAKINKTVSFVTKITNINASSGLKLNKIINI